MELSREAKNIITAMVHDLTKCKYLYSATISWCYDLVIDHSGYLKPVESREVILREVYKVLGEWYKNN